MISIKIVSASDLRNKLGRKWKELKSEQEIVVTHNGKPHALLVSIDVQTLGSTLKAIRQARAVGAIGNMQLSNESVNLDEINQEIAEVRKLREEKTM